MTFSNGLAPTPPMGWNSYDYFGGEINEAEFKANVDYMAARLRDKGWRYAVIDIAWHTSRAMGEFGSEEMDSHGRLIPSVMRFPSSRGGRGFSPLADYVHQRGLRFGIHIMPGVTRTAMAQGLVVEGTSTPLRDIAQPDAFNALWPEQLHYLRPEHPASQAYYDSLMRLYASWGVDFIKADGPGYPYLPEQVAMLHRARERAGRPMVLSISAGCTQHAAWKRHRSQHCEMSRISEDLWDRWPQLEAMFDNFRAWSGFTGPGHWADGDMLPLGRIGARHHPVNAPDRRTRFTAHEQRTLVSLWCIAQSPLMLGGDLPSNTPEDLALITNEEVLEVNQRGRHGRELYRDCHYSAVVWIADIPADGASGQSWALGVFNFNPTESRTIPIPWAETGLPAGSRIRDLWARRDLGRVGETLTVEIAPHGAGLYRVTPAP